MATEASAEDTPAAPPGTSTRRRIVSVAILAVGLVGIGVAAGATMRDAEDVELPGAVPLLIATVVVRIGLGFAATAWVRLLGVREGRRLVAATLYESQLAKYLPAGGFVQAAGQVGLSVLRGIPVRRASTAFLALMASLVASGLAISAALVTEGALSGWLRAAAVLGLAAPVVTHRSVLASFLRAGQRISRRVPGPGDLPDQRSLWTALLLSGGTHLANGISFAILLGAVVDGVPWSGVVFGYIFSWVVGFLVLPLPSGVGVREAVLVAIVPGIPAGPLLAASLAQRLVTIAAELSAVAGNRIQRGIAARAQDPA